MTSSCRPWWRNCAVQSDAEMLAIDVMEDGFAPVSENAAKIRGLISTLELCHHKTERWVDNIIAAIGTGEAEKGLGTRPRDRRHPTEEVWMNACAALLAWVAGRPSSSVELTINDVPAAQVLAGLGERSALKEWQVQRVIEKIRSVLHWPRPVDDPASQYVWLLLSGGDDGPLYRSECPEHYKEHEEFWLSTVRTIIHDTERGDAASLSLGVAIDMLWPCHWGFVENLQIVLDAIGGTLDPDRPFAARARNVGRVPARRRMERIANTLKAFGGAPPGDEERDQETLSRLGAPTEVKAWLAMSLDKTIRLQLDPPDELRESVVLPVPKWVQGFARS